MSLLQQLGLVAPTVKAGAHRAVAAAGADMAEASVPDAQMLNDATAYSQVLAKAQADVASLGSDPSLAADKAKIQADLIDTARGLAKAGGYKGAMSLLGQVAGKVAAALAKVNGDYEKARAAAQKLIDELDKHSQKARVAAKITAAKTKMASAQGHADKREFDAVGKLVAEANQICVAAKTLADDHEKYAKKKADAVALIASFKGVLKDTTLTPLNTKIAQADAKVAAAVPDFPGADTLIESVRTQLGGIVKSWYVTSTKAEIATLKASPTVAYIDKDLKLIEQLQAEVEAAVAAGAWTKAILSGKRMGRILSPASKLVARRADYEAQRTKTDAALAPLKAKPAATGVLAALMLRYQAAEALASRDQVHPEQGAAEMARIEADCPAALQAADVAEAYAKDRASADAQLAALEKHAAVDRLAEPLRAVRKLLADAAAFVAAAAKGPALSNWQAAQAQVTRALADLAAAKTLADSLGPVANAQAAAASAKDAPALKTAIQNLRTAADAGRKQPFGDPADAHYKNVATALKQADDAVGGGDLKGAAAHLADAADHFASARAIQAEHGQFDTLEKTVDARFKALQALPAPMPKSIAAKIDAVKKALADARAKDNAHAGAEAMVALRLAEDAAGAAELAARQREGYNGLAVETGKAVKALTDKKFQAELDKLVQVAEKQADGFNFDAAKASLKGIEVRIAGEKVKSLAKSDPNGPGLAAAAKEMMAKGGGKYLDTLIAQLPDNIDMKAVTTLAKERFGIDFVAGGDSEVPAMRQICVMMAKVPKDSVKNPSMKLVRHEDPGSNSGAYGTVGGVVTMNGRPGQSYQQFGPNLKNSEGGDQLSGVEKDCKPANNDPVDYMDFATLHEVGHAVDDANMFMASREGNPEFGGWKRYGGAIEPIAEAVAKQYGYDKTYVSNKIQRLPAVAPPPPTGTTAKDWSDKQKLVDKWHKIATTKDVWWSQSKCDTISIDTPSGKLVFHEAYEQDWVSYHAAARKKGMTGYQFRAPGEWFAELYASFHSGKLQKTHPSAKWLSKLSV